MKFTPTIIQDTREQAPLYITAYPVEVEGLPVGDYGVRGFSNWDNPAFVCERKSLGDLVGSLTTGRARFMRECAKLRQFGFAAILVEALERDVWQHGYRSQATPQSIMASLDAIRTRHGIHIIFAGNATGAARQFESLVRQFCRGVEGQFKALENSQTSEAQA